MFQLFRSIRTHALTDKQLRAIRRWVSFYTPTLFALCMMVLAVVSFQDWYQINSSVFLFLTASLLFVFSLHRVHESKHGFSDGSTPMWPAVSFGVAISTLMIAVRHSSPGIAVIGSGIIVGTIYVVSRR